ncbi:hypothetical protein OG413_20245 [Streptomyces sp. NBC_01433]|uniref:hypothetical protein n=1 Tax=Streptomyces sp. NBC_01433 TaxID=2903864 RepID=UPI00224E8671|nr:hypothetical protein [Streptomyces sp. NBC_01433]MCX4677605.1 hypothetical protein [Streptomyces sp. NBC_01433]
MASTATYVIDLDAGRREATHPDGIPVLFNKDLLVFPAELPADALDPLLADELGLVALLGEVIDAADGDAGLSDVMNALFRRPQLPRKFMAAVKESYAILLDAEYDDAHRLQDGPFKDFLAAKPSLGDYVRLTMGLTRVYGVELGKLFRSDDSSENNSATSNPTSAGSTDSTPDASGSAPGSKDSSASDG